MSVDPKRRTPTVTPSRRCAIAADPRTDDLDALAEHAALHAALDLDALPASR
jgi:hypothetical protein